LPRAAAAIVHIVMALAIVFGMVQSGGRYFYCEALGLLPSDPCAEASSVASKCPVGAITARHADCCEVVTLEAMPPAAHTANPCVPPAARVALVPVSCPSASMPFVATSGLLRLFERWRPPPRAPNDARAQLMVFVI
jgi:hypothetical protein